jgi:hypothetical protein
MSGLETSAFDSAQSWLETVEGDAPLLLIAPHGGRAGPATHALLNPKVNDLHTAEITRELAKLLGAAALINAGMDRNRLDLNRLSQVSAQAPWFLETIHHRLAEIVASAGHATVLVVHGWNVIQARLDLGLGLRRHDNELRTPGAARISARDDFIHGPLEGLIVRLASHGIITSFGLRYPGGGAQNLLQAFTDRHLENPVTALRELSQMASRHEIDAVQMELSVALRMPGQLRTNCIDSIVEVFKKRSRVDRESHRQPRLTVVRSAAPKPAATAKRAVIPMAPTRVGIELFDPSSNIGAMASFDLGAGGIGARIMVLLPGGRVALFTGEGKPKHEGTRLSLGPLTFESDHGDLILNFDGHAVVVPDATHYLSIERALASGWLDESMRVAIRLHPRLNATPFELDQLLQRRDAADSDTPAAMFGELSGSTRIDGVTTSIAGYGRSGISFTGIGPQQFTSRRMIWACFGDAAAPAAIELRGVATNESEQRSGRVLRHDVWYQCEVESLEVETPSVTAPPIHLSANFVGQDSTRSMLVGAVENFIPLSRPGPNSTRIFTALGFARFKLGDCEGAGMFECSRRSNAPAAGDDEGED